VCPGKTLKKDQGFWIQELYRNDPELAARLRVKGKFSEEFVNWAAKSVHNCDSRFCFVDIGGRVTNENRTICRDAEAIIILSGYPEKIQEWLDFASEMKLKVLAVVHSRLTRLVPDATEWNRVEGGVFVGQAIDLDRDIQRDSKTIAALAAFLIDVVSVNHKENLMNSMTVSQIASMFGKTQEDYEIKGRDGARQVHGLNWKPAELPDVERVLKPFSALGTPWLIDGIMPQWLALTVVHGFHPSVVSLADTKVKGGSVQICQRKTPKGEGAGELGWTVTEHDDHVLVEYSSADPISAEKLEELIPPELPAGKPVRLSGRTATWGVVDVGMAYAHVAPAVFVFQPGTGYVCSVTHRADFVLGSVIN